MFHPLLVTGLAHQPENFQILWPPCGWKHVFAKDVMPTIISYDCAPTVPCIEPLEPRDSGGGEGVGRKPYEIPHQDYRDTTVFEGRRRKE